VNDSEFSIRVKNILDNIVDEIERQDPGGNIDIDLNGGILTLVTDKGVFVINKQSAVKEIWLSSPISGPYHFIYKNGIWKSRSGAELFKILTDELTIKFRTD
jgi:CyaY protein